MVEILKRQHPIFSMAACLKAWPLRRENYFLLPASSLSG
jgi:hypothetical protein